MKIIIDLMHKDFIECLLKNKIVESKGQWRRLIAQKAVDLKSVNLKIGKHRFFQVTIDETL